MKEVYEATWKFLKSLLSEDESLGGVRCILFEREREREMMCASTAATTEPSQEPKQGPLCVFYVKGRTPDFLRAGRTVNVKGMAGAVFRGFFRGSVAAEKD